MHRFEVDAADGADLVCAFVDFGATLDDLTDWRVSVAQTLLKRGKPLKAVAPAVGYSSPAAFLRVFAKRVGASALDWLAAQDGGVAGGS